MPKLRGGANNFLNKVIRDGIHVVISLFPIGWQVAKSRWERIWMTPFNYLEDIEQTISQLWLINNTTFHRFKTLRVLQVQIRLGQMKIQYAWALWVS